MGKGCPKATPAPAPKVVPYDCDVGYDNWKKNWKLSKRAWCCQQKSRGCPQKNPGELYNCDAGYSAWQHVWNSEKKTWCCQNMGRGCRQSTVAHDAQFIVGANVNEAEW